MSNFSTKYSKMKRTSERKVSKEKKKRRVYKYDENYNPFIQIGDAIHHIIAHLFLEPLYFCGTQEKINTTTHYKPSYYNLLSMRSVANLLRTCKSINNTIGPSIRSNKPRRSLLTSPVCCQCNNLVTYCEECRTNCCYKCNKTHLIERYCHECDTDVYCCPCQEKSGIPIYCSWCNLNRTWM